jgi:hypothetical protein
MGKYPVKKKFKKLEEYIKRQRYRTYETKQFLDVIDGIVSRFRLENDNYAATLDHVYNELWELEQIAGKGRRARKK